MSEQTIDRLQIEISASASKSVDGVDRLSHSLQALKAATQGSVGDLGEISMSLRILKETATEIRGTSGTITAISKSLGALKELRLGNLDELKNASSALGTIGDSMNSMREFRSGIGSLKTAFGNLEKFDFDGISIKITGLVEAIKPLTDEMIRGGQGVSNYGTQMKELASAMKMTNSLKGSVGSDSRGVAYTAHRSTSATWNFTKLKAGITVLKEVGTHIGDYVGEINNYIEDLNLFTVAMGDFADRGMSFANRMQDELGVNAGEAMRYMGVFKQMTSSMGFAEERAYTLSQNLTQLAYDMSSFYNLSVEESFTKLQSGLSGEAEPLRRLGIDISATRMQTELYNLGIKQSVEDLSQADKATLRYMTILKQANNALGDLSRSIDSPSNAMRTLNAQWEVAKREIGSVFIPALIKILPPAIAATRILGDLARELAGFLGFELPKIDYSGVGNLSVGLGSASDNADGLKDNLKDVKKEVSGLVGIDEINKLSETGGASGGLSGGSSGSIDVPSVLEGIDMPSYDMFSGIENGVDKWTEKFKGFFSTLKEEIRPFTPLLETMGTLFLSAFGFEWVRRSVTRFGGLEKLKAVISPITRGVGLFKRELAATKNPLKLGSSLLGTYRSKMQGLSGTLKAGIGIAAVGADFLVTYDAVKKLTAGTITVGEAFANILPVFALTEIALYGLMGPWGLAVGAVVALTGAVAGFVKQDLDMHRQMEKDTFFDGYGTKISDIAGGFEAWSDNIRKSNQALIDGREEIKKSHEKVTDLTVGIEDIKKQIELGALSAEDGFPKIKEEIQKLHDESATTLSQIQVNITKALSGAVGQSLEELGVSLPEIMTLVDKTVSSGNAALDESQRKLIDYCNELSGLDRTSKEYAETSAKMSEELKRMGRLSGTVADSDLTKLTDSLSDLAQGIDFESPESFKNAMSSISDSVETAKKSVNDSYDSLIENFESLKIVARETGNDAAVEELDGYIESAKTARTQKLSEIDSVMQTTGELIQNSFAQSVIRAAQNNEPSFADEITAYATRWPDWLLSGFDKALRDQDIASITADRISGDMSKELDSSFKATFPEAAENGIAGLFNGLVSDAALESLKKAATTLSDTIVHFFKKEQKIESPSKVMYELGAYSGQGIINGLDAQKDSLGLTATKMASKITSNFGTELDVLKKNTGIKLDELRGKFSDWRAELKAPHLKWVSDGLKTSGFLKDTLELLNLPTTLPSLKVDWYGYGGIFDKPSVIGVGERGPEAVVPLSENADWIEALSQKIAQREALIAAFAPVPQEPDPGGDWTFVLQRADGTTENEFTVTAAERLNRRHGKTIIPIGV